MCNHLPPESRDENVIKLDHFNLSSLLQGSLTGEAAEKRVAEVRVVVWGGGVRGLGGACETLDCTFCCAPYLFTADLYGCGSVEEVQFVCVQR